jgi:hypothetical protein
MNTIFTLAPSDHPTDPATLEAGYKLWSTFAKSKDGKRFFVRSNREDTAGGQSWHLIAERIGGVWHVSKGNGFFAQGGQLLSRYLISKRAKVRSEVVAYQGKVKRYAATAKVYSLPSILNGYKAVVSRDKLADMRSKARKVSLADMLAAREERKKGGAK